MVRQAAEQGADFITLPEGFALMEENGERLWEQSTGFEDHPALTAMQALAKDIKRWLLLGAIAVRTGEGKKLANRSVLLSDRGEVVAWYDKIHLFDVELPGEKSYRESNRYIYGDRAVLAKTPWGGLGLTICYDVRFPYLYRHLAHRGASFLTVPAAFTRQTGRAHWHVLLRARAIETGCYVIAPAECGEHPGGRQTYGHSLIVDPWGEVLADGGEDEGVVLAEVDPGRVGEIRRRVPSLTHDRSFADG